MELIADIFLVAGALGAGFYCYILARRLTKFNDLEKGVGGAVAVLSAQVDDLSKALAEARSASGVSTEAIADLTHRAESVAQRLELMMASLHDIPEPPKESVAPKQEISPQAQDTEADSPERPSEPIFMRHSVDRKGAA